MNNMNETEDIRQVGTKVYESLTEEERFIIGLYDAEVQKRIDDPEYNEECKAEALRMARGYMGDGCMSGSIGEKLFSHYLMGFNMGMTVMKAIEGGSESSQNASEDGDREDIG